LEQRRPPAALLPIAALRASMAAVRYAPAARLHGLNFRDRPRAVVRRSARERTFDGSNAGRCKVRDLPFVRTARHTTKRASKSLTPSVAYWMRLRRVRSP